MKIGILKAIFKHASNRQMNPYLKIIHKQVFIRFKEKLNGVRFLLFGIRME